MSYINDAALLEEEIETLELEITTADAGNAGSGFNDVFVNVIFSDGTRLYEPFNHRLGPPGSNFILPPKGEHATFELSIPSKLEKKLQDVSEVYIRKSGSNGWFMESLLLFANNHTEPLIGNRNANQFLDNNDDVLLLREWSTASLCVAPAVSARHPLPRAGYRVLGPVIGQVTDTAAVVLYRVDREGEYVMRLRDTVTGTVTDFPLDLLPTGRFELTGLVSERDYEVSLSYLRAGEETPVPDSDGRFRTYPPEQSPGRFAFAFGSCANPDKQAAQGAWSGIRALAQSPPADTEPVCLFVHLGDTFYFYDHMTDETVKNVQSMHAAHVSQRRHIEFLDMARILPCCGVWDDHDFAKDNTDSTDIDSTLKQTAKETWLQYWGNHQPISTTSDLGLSARITHGLVDLYLLDGRYARDKDQGICFGEDLVESLQISIRTRGAVTPRVVILATGSNWTHDLKKNREKYGHNAYEEEREGLFSFLRDLMGSHIKGLILLSGDSHVNEIYHVDLGDGLFAPEFTSSPLTRNTDLTDDSDEPDDDEERVATFPTGGSNGKRGFATLTIDTTDPVAEEHWTARLRHYEEAGLLVHQERVYRLNNAGHFEPD